MGRAQRFAGTAKPTGEYTEVISCPAFFLKWAALIKLNMNVITNQIHMAGGTHLNISTRKSLYHNNYRVNTFITKLFFVC